MRFHPKWDGPIRPDPTGHSLPASGRIVRPEPRLSAERRAQIRGRVADGYYATPAMLSELARRILASGEL